MIKTVAKWAGFLIATLQFFSSLVNTADALTLMAYSPAAGIFCLLGASASVAAFAAVMYGALLKASWTHKAAAAAALLNAAYLIILASVPVPEALLAGMGVPDAQAAAQVMWAFSGAGIFLDAAMAFLFWLCRTKAED